jgi:hypothetical protein
VVVSGMALGEGRDDVRKRRGWVAEAVEVERRDRSRVVVVTTVADGAERVSNGGGVRYKTYRGRRDRIHRGKKRDSTRAMMCGRDEGGVAEAVEVERRGRSRAGADHV